MGKAVGNAASAGHGKDLSSLYVYARCKQEDGIPGQEGTYIRVANKIITTEGTPPQELLPYSLLTNCLKFPAIPSELTELAKPYKVKAYARCWTLDEVKQALAAGKIVVAGVWVTDSFLEWNGVSSIGVPSGSIYGGHAVVFCGYDDAKKAIRGVNSWNTTWGDKGFFWLDYKNMDWTSDLGIPSVFEAWAYEFENVQPEPEPEPGKRPKIELWLDSTTARVDGKAVTLDVAPRTENGRTLIPVRFVAEAMGAKVTWHPMEKRIVIE